MGAYVMDDYRRALLGDREAAKRPTDAGVLVPCPFCGGDADVAAYDQDYCAPLGIMFIAFLATNVK